MFLRSKKKFGYVLYKKNFLEKVDYVIYIFSTANMDSSFYFVVVDIVGNYTTWGKKFNWQHKYNRHQ